MKVYIKLSNSPYIDEDYEDRVKYLYTNNQSTGTTIIDFTNYCNQFINKKNKKVTIYNLIDFWEQANIDSETIKELWIEYKQLWDDDEILNDYHLKLDMIDEFKNGGIEKLLNEIDDYFKIDEFISPYLEFLGYQCIRLDCSSVGYCIATNNLTYGYLCDLWECNNFYDIEILDEQGNIIDNLCECYLPNNEDLAECVDENFNIKKDEINLINNDCSQYFNFNKYNMIPINYKFKAIK